MLVPTHFVLDAEAGVILDAQARAQLLRRNALRQCPQAPAGES
ncbi:hypothetical protein [Kitasatospora sp. MAP5-34]|nr:hypothetical protein [Kitasatospora sp. MAP5-34]MDH6580023.1 hypothetical protein [Kitasatospora sp. MAP5-34]